MSDKPHVPPTPVFRKHEPTEAESKFESVVDQLVAYSELLRKSAMHLEERHRLTEKIAVQFTTELKLIGNILKTMMGVPFEAVKARVDKIDAEPTFLEEIKSFCDYIAPEKPALLTGDAAVSEFMAMRKAGKAPWDVK